MGKNKKSSLRHGFLHLPYVSRELQLLCSAIFPPYLPLKLYLMRTAQTVSLEMVWTSTKHIGPFFFLFFSFFFFPPPHYGVLHSLGLEEQMVVSESGLEKVWRREGGGGGFVQMVKDDHLCQTNSSNPLCHCMWNQ